MVDNYNRKACGSCPQVRQCTVLRSRDWCVQCPQSLRCLVLGIIHGAFCNGRSEAWRKLTIDCNLAYKVALKRKEMNIKSFRVTCPRCLFPYASFSPIRGKIVEGLACSNCGVEVLLGYGSNYSMPNKADSSKGLMYLDVTKIMSNM